ncbi:hypothetical protein EV210_101201 [Anaerospora hongkongensis]|uniref:Uncharacterized protein n=1 Tax=Anaerospora hongkongensis TaxID=244830 RepID=A0A4R1QC16_9FIRM|nr:hypothetical protein [Anaerospora hongkongensis]TCL40001.1 hypothetical protein EV210_101201 [Anaerospora hongkongensis]
MSNKKIYFRLTLKKAYIVKHALRDKPHENEDEEKLFEEITENINDFKARNNIPDKIQSAANNIESQERYIVLGKIFQADLDRCAKWLRDSHGETWTCGDNSCSGHKYCKAYKPDFEEGGE